MTNSQLIGNWIGYTRSGDKAELMRLSFDAMTCDLLGREAIELPVRFTDDGGWIAGDIAFIVEQAGEALTGHLSDGAFFWLTPDRDEASDPHPQIGGVYVGAGRRYHVYSVCDPQANVWWMQYQHDDAVVNLFMLPDGTYFSERCEILTFSPDHLHVAHLDGLTFEAVLTHEVVEHEVQIQSAAGHTLSGSLVLPDEGRYPIVILVHGAGPEVRNNFRRIADRFVRRGMGAFIYDKRGWGNSSGEPLFSEVFRLADDLVDIIQTLHDHPAVEEIGVCGFSNGGWVAPLAASRTGEAVSFVISLSGSGVPPAQQEQVRRCNVAAETLGASPEQVALIREFWEVAFPFIATGEWTPAFEQVLERINNDAGIQALPKHEGMPDGLQPVPPMRTRAEWDEHGGKAPDMVFDSVPVFATLSAAVLCVWGAEDRVVPVPESIAAMRDGMQHHPDFTAIVVPNAGHSLFAIPQSNKLTGSESKRLKASVKRYPAGMWDQITEWARRRVQGEARESANYANYAN